MQRVTRCRITDYTYDSDSDTYTVKSAKGLAFVAQKVNNGGTNINITLADNIDLSTAGVTGYGEDTVTADNSWIPIGNSSYKYTGTFDGAGKIISNLYINTSNSYVGLFGYVDKSGKVENLTVESGDVKATSGTKYVGGIAGRSDGEISNCNSEDRCSVSGYHAGGIAGQTYTGKFVDCVNNGSINGTYCGGIIGHINGNAGYNTIIENCVNNGDIIGSTYAGGIIGECQAGSNARAIVNNCINSGEIKSTYMFAGGIIGCVSYADVVNCANSGLVYGYTGGITGALMTEDSTIINCVNTAKANFGITYYNSGSVSNSYYLQGSANNAVGMETATNCYTFSEINGDYILEDGNNTKLIDKLNEYVNNHAGDGLTSWSSNNGGLQLGDHTVIEPTDPEPSPDTEVTTSAIAVAEDTTAETTLKENNINTADGVYGGEAYGNTISTTFRTTQAIADANSTYGVWTVDLTQGDAYVKSTAGKEGAIVTDGENVKNNKGAIYAMDSSNAGKYKLYFNKNTYLSGSGGVVFGLVIDGLYAPNAGGTFEFTNDTPTDGTELNESNSIFTGAGEDYVHDDNVLHQSSAE